MQIWTLRSKMLRSLKFIPDEFVESINSDKMIKLRRTELDEELSLASEKRRLASFTVCSSSTGS